MQERQAGRIRYRNALSSSSYVKTSSSLQPSSDAAERLTSKQERKLVSVGWFEEEEMRLYRVTYLDDWHAKNTIRFNFLLKKK